MADIEVKTAEFGYELQPIDANAAYPGTAEFGFETRPLIYNLSVDSPEVEWEGPLVDLPSSITIEIKSAEFTWELRPVDIIPIEVHESEYGHEIYSVGIGLLQPHAPEFDREHGDVTLSKVFNPQSSEYDREIEGLEDIASDDLIVYSAEFDRESKSLSITKNLLVTTAEFGYEFRPVDIRNIDVKTAEFDFEAAKVDFSRNNAAVFSAEFDREFPLVIVDSADDARPHNAEFGYEFQPITNIIPVRAQFDFESPDVNIGEISGDIGSPEFDFEADSVAITQASNFAAESSEYGFEAQSVQISTNVIVETVEFEREFGSAEISRVIVVQSSEFDHESTSVEVSQGIGANEYDREFGTPGLVQGYAFTPGGSEYDYEVGSARLPRASEADVRSSEFDWKAQPVRLRAFRRRTKTPRDRVKICRQI